MIDQNSNLKKNLEKILWEFEEVLRKYEVDDLELQISYSSFAERSLKSRTISSLRSVLQECFPLEDKIVRKNHVLAAKSLLKLGKYQETAVEILLEVISNQKYSSLSSDSGILSTEAAELRELAVDAMSEISESMDGMNSDEVFLFDCGPCENCKKTCTDPRTGTSITYNCCKD